MENHQLTKEGRNREEKTKQKKTNQNNEKAINKMALVNPYISVHTLNLSRLNSFSKRHRVAGCIKKQDPTKCGLQETSDLRTQIGESMEKDIPCMQKSRKECYSYSHTRQNRL